MIENSRKQTAGQRDYKERFEFRFTFGNNIICQRYFRINNFNPLSLSSLELVYTIRDCAKMTDFDLKDKTQRYLAMTTSQNFLTEKEMEEYYKDGKHRGNLNDIRLGQGIVIKDPKAPNYVWGKKDEPVALPEKFDKDGEFITPLSDEDIIQYKFAFYDDGREVCSTIWDGVYPKYVRNSIDISNKKGKLSEGDDPSRLSYESYLLYKMVEGKEDIVYKIIKEICYTCSSQDNSWYTTSLSFKTPGGETKKYDNTVRAKEVAKEVRRMEAYLNESSNK